MGQKGSGKIVTLLACLFLVASQIGCSSQKASFQEGEHLENEVYGKTFGTYTLNNAQFQLAIEDQLFEEESGLALYEQVLADHNALAALLESGQPLAIYIVAETPKDRVLLAGSALYCTPDDILKGNYHKALVRAYTGFDQPWKLAGVYGLAFDDPVDLNALVDYYSDSANHATLSLFAAYFFDEFTDRSTLAIAEDTATAFTQFLLAEHGAEVFSQPIGQGDYRQDWLDSIGVPTPYHPAYDLSVLDDAQYASSEKYPLIITTPNKVYAFSGNLVDSPLPLMQLLAYYPTGMDNLLTTLKEEAPTHYAQVQSAWEEPLNIYFDGDLAGTYSEPAKRNLYFPGPGLQNLFYQTIIFLLPPAEGETQIWKSFGLADYLYTLADVPEVSYYYFFQVSPDELTGDNAKYLSEVQAYYLSRAPYPEELEDFDFGLVYEAMAMTTLSNPTLEITYPQIAAHPTAAWSNQENKYLAYSGNSLTIPEAYLFTKYLVETYGLDEMMTYYTLSTTAAFENTFGLSYSEAFADFKAAYGIGQ